MESKLRSMYPMLLLSALVVPTVSGLAALSGRLPVARQDARQHTAVLRIGSATRTAAAERPGCSSCGVVEAISLGQTRGRSGSMQSAEDAGEVGEAFGAAHFYRGGEEGEQPSASHTVRVRMQDGSLRTVQQAGRPRVSIGERIKVIDGAIVKLTGSTIVAAYGIATPRA